MPSSQAQGWPLFMHGFHAWSGHETAPFMPLSLRPLGESCLRLHRFHAWSRPWDSTVSCLDLRPSVMRHHRFMPSSQTVKDHPVSCHEIAPFHAYISGIQGSNLSCTISHISMPRVHRSCLALRLRDDPFSCTVFMPDPAMRQHRSCLSLSGLWVNPV